ncbi:hypothetical protein JTB14_022426 [Gonioctena quinquepunctata]|nr:hypothetical protein JTB14_022426 [Gonioctena quinquepunctata]
MAPQFYRKYVKGEEFFAGIEYDILKILGEKLNFQYRMKEFKTGISGGAKRQMISKIKERKLDWGLSDVTLTEERFKSMDSMVTFAMQHYVAVYRVDRYYQRDADDFIVNKLLLHPYPVLVLFSVIAISVVVKYGLKLSNYAEMTLMSHIIINLQFILDQPLPSRIQIRITRWKGVLKYIICAWWIAALINSSYIKVILRVSFLHSIPGETLNDEVLTTEGFTFESSSCDASLSGAEYETVPIGIGDGQQTWLFAKSTPYVAAFNKVIHKLHDHGLIELW